jgi:uncharacterized GH25 family protein
MTRLSKTLALAAAAVTLAGVSAASAHAVWFQQHSKQLAFIYGIGADDLDSVKRFHLLRTVAGYDADYKPIPTKLKIDGPLVVVDSEGAPAVVTAVMYNDIWTKTPDGEWTKGGKDEIKNGLLSEKNFKYTVHIAQPLTKPLPAFADQRLEIQPVGKIPEKMGRPMKIRVIYEGKPAAHAKVLADFINDPDAKPIYTAKDGTAMIVVRNQGLNVVNAVFHAPSDEPTKVDYLELEATLSFILQHAPE